MNYSDADTPAVLIDLAVASRNIENYQKYCDKNRLNLRPHIKTHKIPELAKLQLAAGAVGITCQKVSEAEAMLSEGGIDDILITYNIYGQSKLQRLLQLSSRCNLSVVADNSVCVKGLSDTFKKQDKPLQVLVECDTGALRCGVVTPEEAFLLAQEITNLPGLKFGGLMTYPPISQQKKVNRFLELTKALIEENGIKVEIVSIGGSPNMWEVEKIPIGTEYRIGTYIYNDRSLIERKVCREEDCALTVLATVVSIPTSQRAVIDAGSKILTTDLFGLAGHGHVIDHPHLTISQLSEEHACIFSDGPTGLSIGQKVRIIPNHACVVSNMVDEVVFIDGSKVLKRQSVVARGKVS
tara:strand:- start:3794 stop:4852 length:1059 start_codon:yes stop_codon:yes gene_type:complete